MMAAAAALRMGQKDQAIQMLRRHMEGAFGQTLLRLDPQLHPLLDQEPYAPRRWDATIVWPLEAPMIDPAIYAVFREVRIESGLLDASEVLPR